ncbi:MAG: hypothetical protein J1D77_06520, partial [Muribaculaceae bacterium]|nr:hypothetical protein [Muribaculaceae bacterium]
LLIHNFTNATIKLSMKRLNGLMRRLLYLWGIIWSKITNFFSDSKKIGLILHKFLMLKQVWLA